LASNLVLLRHRVIKPVFLGVALGASACLGLGQWLWGASLITGGVFGALGFWLFVRAQETMVANRHYGRFFSYFLARLAVYALPIGYAAASPMLSMPVTLAGLFSYNAYLIVVLIVKARRGLR
jgi:hypothetical protein